MNEMVAVGSVGQPSRIWRYSYSVFLAGLLLLGLILFGALFLVPDGFSPEGLRLAIGICLASGAALFSTATKYRHQGMFRAWLFWNLPLGLLFAFIIYDTRTAPNVPLLVVAATYLSFMFAQARGRGLLGDVLILTVAALYFLSLTSLIPYVANFHKLILAGLYILGISVIALSAERRNTTLAKAHLFAVLAGQIFAGILTVLYAHTQILPAHETTRWEDLVGVGAELVHFHPDPYGEAESVALSADGRNKYMVPRSGLVAPNGAYYAICREGVGRNDRDIVFSVDTPGESCTVIIKHIQTGNEVIVQDASSSVDRLYWTGDELLEVTMMNDFNHTRRYYDYLGRETTTSQPIHHIVPDSEFSENDDYALKKDWLAGFGRRKPWNLLNKRHNKVIGMPSDGYRFNEVEWRLKVGGGLIFSDNRNNLFLMDLHGTYIRIGSGDIREF